MRILFLTHRLPHAPNRGDRIRAYHLLREMSRFAAVSLFSLVHDDDEEARAGDVPFASEVVVARATRVRNLVKGAARFASSRPLTHSLLDAPDAHAALVRLVSASPPDVVVAYCSGMARFAFEPPLDDVPLVLDMVDVDSVKWAQLASEARGPRRLVYAREATTLGAFEARAAQRARATLVVNERECDALRQIAPGAQIRIVPNGIAVGDFAPTAPPADSPVVVFCGVLDYYPNEEGVRWFAEHVWPRVRSAMPGARFVVVGSSPTRAIRDLAARDPSVTVVGGVPSTQPYLSQSAISVAPLRLAHGLQNKVLEALAAGLPVVATLPVWNGLPPEAQAGCVATDDPAAFAERVLYLLRCPPAERRRQASAARLERLSWANQLQPLESILREAATRSSLALAR